MTPADLRLLYGTEQPPLPARALQAGRLIATLRGTQLGPLHFDGHEVWHGVDFLYRDGDWGTPEPVVDDLAQAETADGLHFSLRGHIPAGTPIDFCIEIAISERSLRYAVEATPRGDLSANRMGVVLMHPLTACARPVEVEHTDGRTSASTFPTRIAPWPPFTLVRAIRHEYAEGAWASCRFEGDDFELDDQRNNADASFKTYSRSNLMPRPYGLRGGAVVRQAVQLSIEGSPARPVAAGTGPVRVQIEGPALPWPAIGTSIAPADTQMAEALAGPVRDLAPSLLQLGLDRPEQDFDAAGVACLLRAAGACALRIDVDGVDPLRADMQLGRIASVLAQAGVAPSAIAAFPSSPPVLAAARRAFPRALIGGGTPHFFTQLNRIEDLGRADFLCFATSAVVHGAADDDIMAGLLSLPAMIETLGVRHGPLPVHVGPSGIGARRSPLGGQPPSDGNRRVALARRDPRTDGLYGAAWAVGHVATLAADGARALTLFGLQGDAALWRDGVPTPAFEVLRRLGAPARLHATRVSVPHAVAALAFEREGRLQLLLANLRNESVEVALGSIATPDHVQVMELASLQRQRVGAQASPWRDVRPERSVLRLSPYAVAFV